jgi:hypothetical protein
MEFGYTVSLVAVALSSNIALDLLINVLSTGCQRLSFVFPRELQLLNLNRCQIIVLHLCLVCNALLVASALPLSLYPGRSLPFLNLIISPS